MPIESGKRYVFVNKKSGTALDLNTRDNRSVQGWARHGGPNQQWEAVQARTHWLFRNVELGNGGFLNREGTNDGRKIICAPGIFSWKVEQIGENVYRFVDLSSSKSIDLADGSGLNGTPVQIWSSTVGNENQLWEAQQV